MLTRFQQLKLQSVLASEVLVVLLVLLVHLVQDAGQVLGLCAIHVVLQFGFLIVCQFHQKFAHVDVLGLVALVLTES